MGKLIRLDKFLVDMNHGSRSQVKEAAKKGRIQVNGCVQKKTDGKIDPDVDTVTFDGSPVRYRSMEYYMLHKPQGVVSATEDNVHPTVIDLLGDGTRKDLFPVGRLDIDTEGLLIITNDGDLAHRLLAPKKHVNKQYYARVEGTLPPDSIHVMAEGMTLLDETVVRPAQLEIIDQANDAAEVLLTIHEGKFHQVKRMFEALGCQVKYLKRCSMGPIRLDPDLKPGEYRELYPVELDMILQTEPEL